MKLNGSDTAVSTLSKCILKHGRTSTTHTCPSVRPGLGRVVDVPICFAFHLGTTPFVQGGGLLQRTLPIPRDQEPAHSSGGPESLLSALVIVPNTGIQSLRHSDLVAATMNGRTSLILRGVWVSFVVE